MTQFARLVIAATWSVSAACASPPELGQQASGTAQAAASEVCEHRVSPELCPKCNPSLAPIYQANGDWCGEHGMPESFCPVCHPEAKGLPTDGKPSKPSSDTKAPGDGLKVRLQSDATAVGAGIEIAVITRAPEKTAARFSARVVYDVTRTAEITASAGGVLRAVRVDLGASVKAGDTLAVLDSADVGADRTRLSAAYQRVKAAEERVERLSSLEREGVVPKRDRIEADLALDEARAEVAALSIELKVYGANTGKGGSYSLLAPIDGVVTRNTAAIGKLVEARDTLFQIVDPSVLWVDIDVPEASLGQVHPADDVVFTVPSLPGEAFGGKVKVILPEVDRHTRTVTARVSVENAQGRLRANMFGEAAVMSAPPSGSVLLPRAALQTVDKQRFVFVRTAPLLYEVRHVTVASRDGETTVIREGLRPGEEVVTTGSFLLKTETLKDSIGAGCCAAD